MSPVIGIRRSAETKMAVPVTLSSGAHRKSRPPPGALAMLEEELVARRGFWRRQRGKEEEVSGQQHQLAVSLMFYLEHTASRSVLVPQRPPIWAQSRSPMLGPNLVTVWCLIDWDKIGHQVGQVWEFCNISFLYILIEQYSYYSNRGKTLL